MPNYLRSQQLREPPVLRRTAFFYFNDYSDLSAQLAAAGWIAPFQHEAIMRAVGRDRLPDLMACVDACDLRGLRSGIVDWSQSAAEGDEVEQEHFALAGEKLPDVVRAHVRLALPPAGVGVLSLQVMAVRIGHVSWPNSEQFMPRLYLHDISTSHLANNVSRHIEWRSDDSGSLNLPWPAETLCRGGARTAIDIRSPFAAPARCFVTLEEATGAIRDHGTAEATLLTPTSCPDVSNPIGELTLNVRWFARGSQPVSY